MKVYWSPPSAARACKDPIAQVTKSQLASLDPKGDREALFDYRRNPRSVRPGDVIRVTFKNGDPFNGVVLSIKLRGIDTSFLMRNEINRTSVEMSVKVFNPNISSVEIVQRAPRKIRRARLYYMRSVKPMAHDLFSMTSTDSSQVSQARSSQCGEYRGILCSPEEGILGWCWQQEPVIWQDFGVMYRISKMYYICSYSTVIQTWSSKHTRSIKMNNTRQFSNRYVDDRKLCYNKPE